MLSQFLLCYAPRTAFYDLCTMARPRTDTDLVPSPESDSPAVSLSRLAAEGGELESVLLPLAGYASQYDEDVVRRKTSKFDRGNAANAFQEAFDLIGGVPRLAVWAHYNEKEFYRLYGKMLPTAASQDLNVSGEVIIRPALPPSPLDDKPELTDDGVIIEGSSEEVVEPQGSFENEPDGQD